MARRPRSSPASVIAPSAPAWTHNEIGRVPVVSDNVQLINSSRRRPVVGSDKGMLIGEQRSGARRLWVLADPDVIENYGLGAPANAEFSVALIDALRGADGNVVFDEMYGFTDGTIVAAADPVRVSLRAGDRARRRKVALLWATMRWFGAGRLLAAGGKRSLIDDRQSVRARPPSSDDLQRYIHDRAGWSAPDARAGRAHRAGATGRPASAARDIEADCGTIVRAPTTWWRAAGAAAAPRLALAARDIFRWEVTILEFRHTRLLT